MGTESRGGISRRCGTFRDKGARSSGSERSGEPGARPSGSAGQRPPAWGTRPPLLGHSESGLEQAFWFRSRVVLRHVLKELQKHP